MNDRSLTSTKWRILKTAILARLDLAKNPILSLDVLKLVHSMQHKLCRRKTELTLETNFHPDCAVLQGAVCVVLHEGNVVRSCIAHRQVCPWLPAEQRSMTEWIPVCAIFAGSFWAHVICRFLIIALHLYWAAWSAQFSWLIQFRMMAIWRP